MNDDHDDDDYNDDDDDDDYDYCRGSSRVVHTLS
jgi:hypothetical protein